MLFPANFIYCTRIEQHFSSVLSGKKKFEIRKDDRKFKTGDELILKEFDRNNNVYTGRMLHRKVDYVLRDDYVGLSEGYCILSLSKI